MDVKTYIEHQVEYFKKHARTTDKLLGVEFEHFLVDRETLRSYSYFEPGGQKDIVQGLLKNNSNWRLISQQDGYPLGLEKDGSTITFEPGGQVEISIKPFEKIAEVDAAYRRIIDDIYSQMLPNQILVSVGYHPKTEIATLPILPKKRYEMMFEYFKNHGAKSHNMMKGTAATQVSIDYCDEADFVKKYKVAHFLAPVLASLFDSTPIFEGKIYDKENPRVAIWEETDPVRSKLVPGAISKTFDFRSYAEYLLDVPPILVNKDGVDIYTGEATLRELLHRYDFSEKELEHIQSMVFPDVRLKKFIEIRMADALPYPYGLAVVAMIKGIFYTPSLLDKLYEKAKGFDDQWVLEQNKGLIEMPVKVDETFIALKKNLMEETLKVVTNEERYYLDDFYKLVNEYGSVANWLKELYRNDRDLFIKTIEVPSSKR
ncbi:glutamate--cysteine ligase [Alkalicella caledoniensis]|uniref:glutamate--cysteine ligase n=1 Tax=Alkalicella caledoniensis TaxID=2731377 RepID=A0A7G9W5U2_ALKCA|nr:glutamate-cysteine ligase family protein [Alkalicella caledoniensis]QNO14054.1 glutamate--cysteine ligase [Alkalicella caledoniensis]